VDTAGHRILAHYCDFGEPGEAGETAPELLAPAIRSGAGWQTDGLYFIQAGNRDPRFRSILDAIREADLQPANFVFEVPEPRSHQNPNYLRKLCDGYRQNGFGLALTHSGTGSNSLLTLNDIRPHYIKLDKTLVRDIERPVNAAMIQILADFAERLGIRVVANGVERHRTVENLWLLGIRVMQGSLFGAPASAIIH
jgi:EAL domain-containing protein (putative c-di-GMP-specific phosphodiesterase class I)